MKLVTGIIAALFLAALTMASLASDEADRFVRMGWSNTDFTPDHRAAVGSDVGRAAARRYPTNRQAAVPAGKRKQRT